MCRHRGPIVPEPQGPCLPSALAALSLAVAVPSGRRYFVLALDPTRCGGQNSLRRFACEYGRLPGVPGDEKGPATMVPID